MFNQGFEEDEEEREERNKEGIDRTQHSTFDATENFTQNWNWFYLIDQVSDLTKETWDNVLKKNIYEFLNLVCYIKSKRAMEKNEMEKFKRK